jgi:hypothetical protein
VNRLAQTAGHRFYVDVIAEIHALSLANVCDKGILGLAAAYRPNCSSKEARRTDLLQPETPRGFIGFG